MGNEGDLEQIDSEMQYHKDRVEGYANLIKEKYSEVNACQLNVFAHNARIQELDFYRQKIMEAQPKPTPAPPAPGTHLSDEQMHESIRRAKPQQQAKPQTAKQKEQSTNDEDFPPVPLPYDKRFGSGGNR